jgi:plasmid stabilization system protein ParE
MHKNIIWSPLAENDLTEILLYLQNNWGERVTGRFINLTDYSIQQISKNPRQFPLIHNKKKIRRCVLTKHNSLFYRANKVNIDILRIFDSRQNPKKLKFR